MTDKQINDGGNEPTDTELLDWLDAQRTNYGLGIVFRMSTIGRGWRLHETSDSWTPDGAVITPKPTAREAIADARSNAMKTKMNYQEVKDACIKLCVPDSGDELLNALITKSLRQRYAGEALAGFSLGHFKDVADAADLAKGAFFVADALIAEGKGNTNDG